MITRTNPVVPVGDPQWDALDVRVLGDDLSEVVVGTDVISDMVGGTHFDVIVFRGSGDDLVSAWKGHPAHLAPGHPGQTACLVHKGFEVPPRRRIWSTMEVTASLPP